MARLPGELEATLALLRSQAEDGVCRVSQTELARQQGVSWSTVHRRLKRLAELGYVEIERVSGQPSRYHLTEEEPGSSAVVNAARRLFTALGWSRGPQPTDSHASPSAQAGPPAVDVTVGRDEVLAALRENVAKRRPTLLVGAPGIGKSHLLRVLRDGAGAGCLYLEHVAPIKPALLELARLLHADGALAVAGIEAHYMEWEDVRKKVAPRRVNQLASLVVDGLREGDYVLILDHLERVTPTMLPHLEALMEVAVVVGAADELKPSARRLWWAFEHIEVPPLSREQARALLWQVADGERVAQPQLFETQVLRQAGGNPLAIISMAAKARAAELSAHEIRGLRHGAGIRYVPLTPILMVLGAVIVAARFVALGLNDRDLYVLAGLGYAFFFVMRYFIYRLD